MLHKYHTCDINTRTPFQSTTCLGAQVHLQAAVAAWLPASWGLSSSATGPSAALDALQELSRSSSQALFWPLWLLFPGLQVRHIQLLSDLAAAALLAHAAHE